MRFSDPESFWYAVCLPQAAISFAKTDGPTRARNGLVFCDNSTCEPAGKGCREADRSDGRLQDRGRFIMQIYGPAQLHGAQPISAPNFHRTNETAPLSNPTSIDTADELQLSPAAELASKMSEIPDIRWERVNSIKAAIADGSYMSADKLDIAMERLLDEIA